MSGYRAAIATSILKRAGFKVRDINGGFAAISVYAPDLTTTGKVAFKWNLIKPDWSLHCHADLSNNEKIDWRYEENLSKHQSAFIGNAISEWLYALALIVSGITLLSWCWIVDVVVCFGCFFFFCSVISFVSCIVNWLFCTGPDDDNVNWRNSYISQIAFVSRKMKPWAFYGNSCHKLILS